MPFILKLQTFFEQRLDAFGPSELAGIAAELLVALTLFLPLASLAAFAGWWIKRYLPVLPDLRLAHPAHTVGTTSNETSAPRKVA